ncbi:hypothetical protein DPMN_173191 [Dreissena polymorpha]|uniref:Uncharacterized protein n=1 Tax=Dreissena polymorpha TaxID=45954 RepID=A0A9D4IGQ5_DREPO|nr:hypothetical protein DPMN_173191 [Dreissena polymorpha]
MQVAIFTIMCVPTLLNPDVSHLKPLTPALLDVFEQFPPEIQEKRRRLVPKMKEAKRDGKKAWIAYDTLYIDGRPFPPEIQEKRRRLVPKMKEAKRDGKKAWIAYDTLYIDGRPVSQ